jgi:hypothetical protein
MDNLTSNPDDMIEPADKMKKLSAGVSVRSLKIAAVVVLVIILGIIGFFWFVFYGPKWGTMHYGVCKVFAERMIDFPTTMNVREVEYFGWNIRLFISHIDAAGQFNYNIVECYYGKQSLEITRIRVDRKVLSDTSETEPVNPEMIRSFNKGLDAILLNPPSLLMPRSTLNAPLSELWRGED